MLLSRTLQRIGALGLLLMTATISAFVIIPVVDRVQDRLQVRAAAGHQYCELLA